MKTRKEMAMTTKKIMMMDHRKVQKKVQLQEVMIVTKTEALTSMRIPTHDQKREAA